MTLDRQLEQAVEALRKAITSYYTDAKPRTDNPKGATCTCAACIASRAYDSARARVKGDR